MHVIIYFSLSTASFCVVIVIFGFRHRVSMCFPGCSGTFTLALLLQCGDSSCVPSHQPSL